MGRRRLQRLVTAGVLGTVVAGFLLALRSPLLDVDQIVVSAPAHTRPEALAAASGVERGTPLMDVDVGAAAERVAQLPWVDEASVSRRVDGTIEIAVSERQPVVQVQVGDQVLLSDSERRLLGAVAEAPELGAGLVTIAGLGDELSPGDRLPPAGTALVQVATALGEQVPGAVTRVELTAPADGGKKEIFATLAQGGKVRFGDAAQLDAKVLSLVTMLDQVDTTGLATLDLRLPGNPVLTREAGA